MGDLGQAPTRSPEPTGGPPERWVAARAPSRELEPVDYDPWIQVTLSMLQLLDDK